jgi:serine/threonine protein kinase
METIGKYRIERKLGQGGMGIVYKCLDPEGGLSAAVKVLPQQLAADPSFLQRFKREIITLQRLDHPNIIKIYEQGDAGGSWFYAMEYADGVSLEDVLASAKRIEPLRAIAIVRSCAEALEHSHARGVVHRDIKPANIMLIKDDGVKLMDFGIAKVLDATRMTMTQGVLGTVEYMSPEQSQGRLVDGKSDIYSLGVVLYRCITGKLPITGSTPTDVIMKLRMQQIDPPREWVPEIPRRLDDLIMRMLAKDPAKRVESARELIRELDRVKQQVENGGTEVDKKSTRERILRTGVRSARRSWLNPWMIGFIILVIGIAVWYVNREETPPPETTIGEPAATGRETGYRRRQLLLEWAQRDRRRGDLDSAEDLCNHIIQFYPESGEAKEAAQELEIITARRLAMEAADTEARRNGGTPENGLTTKE